MFQLVVSYFIKIEPLIYKRFSSLQNSFMIFQQVTPSLDHLSIHFKLFRLAQDLCRLGQHTLNKILLLFRLCVSFQLNSNFLPQCGCVSLISANQRIALYPRQHRGKYSKTSQVRHSHTFDNRIYPLVLTLYPTSIVWTPPRRLNIWRRLCYTV